MCHANAHRQSGGGRAAHSVAAPELAHWAPAVAVAQAQIIIHGSATQTPLKEMCPPAHTGADAELPGPCHPFPRGAAGRLVTESFW